ncbi:uncharacterized protein LOC117151741 [Bombus impatiens]|uniref:Uncharacterized protein LOC117151741 n=1 Tax=Bombus impatiens TaxID=132113 RepID=A0A6P8L0F5_BOMIM|nr:uncharacterized protein LOC117151741 [Bombus impatiens]
MDDLSSTYFMTDILSAVTLGCLTSVFLIVAKSFACHKRVKINIIGESINWRRACLDDLSGEVGCGKWNNDEEQREDQREEGKQLVLSLTMRNLLNTSLAACKRGRKSVK